MRGTITAAVLLLAAGPAAAQYGYGQPTPGYGPTTPLNYLPNYYNRTNQPLSPYLNLLRGGNPGVNYYYGVRPGLPSGGATPFGAAPNYAPMYSTQAGTAAGGFLPQAAIPYDPNRPEFESGGQPIELRSAGHPVLYGNQFAGHGSYASVYAGAINRSGFLPGGQQRPALGGLGAANQRPGTTPPRTGGGGAPRR